MKTHIPNTPIKFAKNRDMKKMKAHAAKLRKKGLSQKAVMIETAKKFDIILIDDGSEIPFDSKGNEEKNSD